MRLPFRFSRKEGGEMVWNAEGKGAYWEKRDLEFWVPENFWDAYIKRFVCA